MKRQRERFRKEALRREREASIAKGNAEQLTRDNQDLRRENMHLYKKIRQAACIPPTRLVFRGQKLLKRSLLCPSAK